jgi:hypothetical protein
VAVFGKHYLSPASTACIVVLLPSVSKEPVSRVAQGGNKAKCNLGIAVAEILLNLFQPG